MNDLYRCLAFSEALEREAEKTLRQEVEYGGIITVRTRADGDKGPKEKRALFKDGIWT